MNYIVVDLEFNQHEDPTRKTRLKFEIMQIGAVKVSEDARILGVFERKVKPTYYSHVCKRVKKITHLSEADLKNGVKFPVALNEFKEWCGTDFVLMSWGPDDESVLRNNMLFHAMSQKWLPKFYDIQAIFGKEFLNTHCQIALTKAVEYFDEKSYDAHDALNDSLNAAAILMHMDIPYVVSNYSDIINKWCEDDCKLSEFSEIAFSKKEAVENPLVSEFTCPKCGIPVSCDIWIPHKSKLFSYCKCSAGDEYFVRLKFSVNEANRYSVKRAIYEMDDQKREKYNEICLMNLQNAIMLYT